MTDLRPLMGLRFECVSVSYSPGLDSKGPHERKLRGVREPQQGCSPHYCAIYLWTSWQSFNVLNKPLRLLLWPEIRDPEHWRYNSFSPHFHSVHSTSTHLSKTQDCISGGTFSKLLSHDIASFLLTFEPTDFCESKARPNLCVFSGVWFGVGFLGFFKNTAFGLSCSAYYKIHNN